MHLMKIQLVYLLTSLMWIHIGCVENAEVPGYYVGCFRYHYPDNDAPDFTHKIDGTAAAQTVENCLAECLKLFFRFIGLMNGQSCWCGSSFGSQGAALCPQTCYGNSSQFCGGFQALSVYATGRMGE
ncbi:hypothetical protein J6590_050452 [Homalodisca vitripennis]|nr:hypothetical protein J6590_050452 [Homalodisca vitripennis]